MKKSTGKDVLSQLEESWLLYEACDKLYHDDIFEKRVTVISSKGNVVSYECEMFKISNDVMFICKSRIRTVVDFVFLGSNDSKDWRNNADIKKTELDTHNGFTDPYATQFLPIIISTIQGSGYWEHIGFKGYSRGAALAELSAFFFAKATKKKYYDFINLTVIAKPHTGGIKYNRLLSNLINTDKYVMAIITGDPVIDIPPSELGYCHNFTCNKVILPKPWWGIFKIPFIGIRLHMYYGKAIKKLMARSLLK